MRLLGLSLLLLSSSAFADGEKVYNAVCKACHGEFGGKPVIPQARNLKTSVYKNAKGATVEGILEVLEKGLPGTAMVAQLHVKPADRKAVAEWIVSQRKPAAPAQEPKAKTPKDDTTKGNDAKPKDTTTDSTATGDTAQAPATEPPPAAKEPETKTISLAEAMAIELRTSKALGLTVYKGNNLLLPGLNVLGLSNKLPDPVMPGQDETAIPLGPDGKPLPLPPADDKAKQAK